MITKEEAIDIAIKYLNGRGRIYYKLSKADEVNYFKDREMFYGKKVGEIIKNIAVVSYANWNDRGEYIYIDADTGEVLYTSGPHGPVEMCEDNK